MRLPLGKTVVTSEPVIVVDGDIPPGEYRVELVVENLEQQRSLSATLALKIVESGTPREP